MQVTIPDWMISWFFITLIFAALTIWSLGVAYAFLLWSTRAAKKAMATYDAYVIRWWMDELRNNRGLPIPTKKAVTEYLNKQDQQKETQ